MDKKTLIGSVLFALVYFSLVFIINKIFVDKDFIRFLLIGVVFTILFYLTSALIKKYS